MAAIDKIYATKAERDEFHQWCSGHKPDALPYFYDWKWSDDGTYPITNFPEDIDGWLVLNCPIEFVLERIGEQYGLHIQRLG